MGKKHKKAQKQSRPSTQKKEHEKEEETDSRFGGLPDRDLKKNLGCGG